jgi:hypothetical protein
VEEETAERDSREKLRERNWRSCHPATDLFVIDRDRPREREREGREGEIPRGVVVCTEEKFKVPLLDAGVAVFVNSQGIFESRF